MFMFKKSTSCTVSFYRIDQSSKTINLGPDIGTDPGKVKKLHLLMLHVSFLCLYLLPLRARFDTRSISKRSSLFWNLCFPSPRPVTILRLKSILFIAGVGRIVECILFQIYEMQTASFRQGCFRRWGAELATCILQCVVCSWWAESR